MEEGQASMSLSSNSHRWPNYASPPVVETVLGVQFERMPGWSNAHLGAFWSEIGRDAWPSAVDAPPILPQFEQFTEGAQWAKGLQLKIGQIQSSRVQFRNRADDRMIQVQNGRLHFNWLGGSYPRYESVRDGFLDVLSKLVAFAEKNNTGPFLPNQWEVSYFNNVPKGELWQSPADWDFFRPLNGLPSIPSLIDGESFTGQWHFVIPGERGRLHIEWQHGLKSEPDKTEEELVRLTFTARGPIDQTSQAPVEQVVCDGLDLGHDTIVRTFELLMSEKANTAWGLQK